VHLYGVFVTVQPIIYLVSETYAQIVCGTLLVKYQALPATGTSEITTVVYGQPNVFDVIGLVVHHVSPTYVRTLMFIAVTVCAISDAVLHLSMHVATDDII
jgi:hypothetical protein